MTISSTDRVAGPFIGNDTADDFPFEFKVFTAADVLVVQLDDDTQIESTLVLNTDYTVALNSDQNANPGGTVTLPAALAAGQTLTITSSIAALQPTDLTNQGGFYPAVITNALDRLTILIQQLLSLVSRSLTLPLSTPSGVSTELPLPDASKLIGWNADADGFENYDASTLATLVAYGTANADLFSGDGTTTVFALSANPAVLNNLDVSIAGVTQTPVVDYTWTSGTNITFTTAPPVGTGNILVRYMQGLSAPDTAIRGELAASTGASLVGWVQSGTGAVARWIRDKLRESVSVKDFGALGDGTTNDYAAVLAADTYASANDKALFFPAGTYCVGTMLNPTTNKSRWYGEGEHRSIIKRLSGAAINSVLHIGPVTGTAVTQFASFERLGFDGNSGCADAVVKCRNMQHSKLRFLDITGGSSHGLRTDTSTVSINTNALRNEFSSIVSRSNVGDGFQYQGEKDTRFDMLLSHNNTARGFLFKAFRDDGALLAETTECVIGSLIARDNGGDGFLFDMCEKYVAGSLLSAINGGVGLRFNSSYTTAVSKGSNSIAIGSLISRNDASGGIRLADSAYISGVQIANAYLLGYGSSVGGRGIAISGANRVHFGNCTVLGFKADGVLINAGTPLGVAGNSSDIHFDKLLLLSNGDAGAGSQGLNVLDSTSSVTINSLRSTNSQTTGANYELNFANTVGPVFIAYAHLSAATDGNETNIGTADLHIGHYKRRNDAVVMTLRDGVAAPGTNLAGHALLYVDSADGDYKIRFSDGVVKTITIDS